jgi:glutaredoxin-related protein
VIVIKRKSNISFNIIRKSITSNISLRKMVKKYQEWHNKDECWYFQGGLVGGFIRDV